MFNRKKKLSPIVFQHSRSGMYFLLAGLTVVLIAHIPHLPLWTTLTCFWLIIWRGLYDIKRVPLPNKFILFLILGLILFGVISSYQTIFGRHAGSALLLSLLFLKLFEIKSLRDISFIAQLALFSIVVAFLFSNSIFMAVSMLVAVVLLITSLISFQHAKSGKFISKHAQKQHVLLSAKMIAYAIPLTIIIFIVFPRTSSPLWGLPQDAFQARTGLSDTMSPGRISELSESQAVAFRVKFKSKRPLPEKIYWRGPVLWSYNGDTWSAPESRRDTLNKTMLLEPSKRVDYTITLEPHNNFWLFALDLPDSIPPFARLSSDMQLISRKRINHITRYEQSSYLDYTVPWNEGHSPERYLSIPAAAAPRARQFIKQLSQKYPDKSERVDAVLNYFNQQDFYYSRQPPLLFDDPVDEFLFETKRGYCEHYASTFTVLMRLAGIPARVVTGYQGGEMNPFSNYMIVRQSDAHAWSEVYLENKGWVRVDPTAVIPVANIENINDAARLRTELMASIKLSNQSWLYSSAKQFGFAWDLVNNGWNQWVIGYTTKKQKSFFKALGITDITWKGLGYLMFITLTTFILIVAVNMYRTQKIRKNALEKIYCKFLNKLRIYRIEQAPSEGALYFSQRVATRFPDRKMDLLNIAILYNRIRYSNLDAIDELRKAVKAIQFRKN